MLFTSKLGLSKPENGPGTDDLVDVDVLTADLDLIDSNIGSKVCTSATRPDNGANGIRFTGQWIFETDTKAYGIWNGSAWRMFDTEWQTYTPTWGASTTNPVKNNGTLIGRYARSGGTIDMHIEMKAGSTTTFGVGAWTFTLPPGFNSRNQERVHMNLMASDLSSGGIYTGAFFWVGAASFGTCLYTSVTGAIVGTNSLDSNSPFVWAVNDTLVINGSYEWA